MKNPFLDKLIDRLDRVDTQSLQGVVLKLAREKGFLETLFNTIQEGVLVTDVAGCIHYSNAAAADLLGLDSARARGAGEPLSRYLRDIDWANLCRAGKEHWASVVAREIEVLHPRHRFLSFYIVPLQDEDDSATVTGLAVILRDITESRQRTASAIETERASALTVLAAGVAHEIGNPLNSLNIHLQLMERDLRNLPRSQADSFRQNLRVARDEITRLDNIIKQFLRAVRPARPDLQRENLNAILRDTLALLEPEITDRDILVECDLAPDLPKLLLDRAQLKQAFFNVIRNALQAMTAGGILRIHTTTQDGYAITSFTDTGHGIALDQIGRIFEPYYTTKEQGTGLGLLIVQRIVRDHGGMLDIESNVGRGTTLRIKLPIHEKRTRLLEAGSHQAP